MSSFRFKLDRWRASLRTHREYRAVSWVAQARKKKQVGGAEEPEPPPPPPTTEPAALSRRKAAPLPRQSYRKPTKSKEKLLAERQAAQADAGEGRVQWLDSVQLEQQVAALSQQQPAERPLMYIDGYNYLFQTYPELLNSKDYDEHKRNSAIDQKRTCVHQQLKSFLQSADYHIVVVYDSSNATEQTSYQLPGSRLEVVFSSRSTEADSYIIREVERLKQQAAQNHHQQHRKVFIVSNDTRVKAPAFEDDLLPVYAQPTGWLQRQLREEQLRQRRTGSLPLPKAPVPKHATVSQNPVSSWAERILRQQAPIAGVPAAAAGVAAGGGVKGRSLQEQEEEQEEEESWAKECLEELDGCGVEELDAVLSADFLKSLGIE